MNEEAVRAEEYRQMTNIFGKMATEFGRIADIIEEENRAKAAKKAMKANMERKEYNSLFTPEELALLRTAEDARARNAGDAEDIDGNKPGIVSFAKRAAPITKRSRDRDLTLSSGTRNFGDRSKAESGSSLRGNVTMQNIGIQRESMGRIRRAVNKEQETIDRIRESESIRIGARALADKLQNKSWLELSAEELEQAKELFGDKLPEILRLNEKKFGPF